MRERLDGLGVDRRHARGRSTRRPCAAACARRSIRAGSCLRRRSCCASIGNTLPPPYKFRPAGDLATEVEWAKNRRLTPDTYLAEPRRPRAADPARSDDPHLSRATSSERRTEGFVDFEDVLELTIRLFDEVTRRARRGSGALSGAFTVDEYQDVNLLQQTLLDRWLGERDELCAVGDDYQSIYAFTGATPQYLLGLPRRFPKATRHQARGELPLVAGGARAREPDRPGARRGGEDPARDRRRGTRARGSSVPDADARDGVRRRPRAGVARTRACRSRRSRSSAARTRVWPTSRSRFHEAKIPFQGAALARARGGASAAAADCGGTTRRDVAATGPRRCAGMRAGSSRRRRSSASGSWCARPISARLVDLAEEFDDGERDCARLHRGPRGAVRLDRRRATRRPPPDVARRERARVRGRLHAAGRGEASCRSGRRRSPRRSRRSGACFYVGLTRAKRQLALTWSGQAEPVPGRSSACVAAPAKAAEPDDPLYAALKRWRLERATADDLPAYVVFHNSTLAQIAGRRPRDLSELGAVPGVGPTKLERYGRDVLAVLSAA